MKHRFALTLTAIGVTVALAVPALGVLATGTAVASPGATAAAADTPQCLQTTDNAKFVRWMYVQYLFRCPDPGGLQFWTAALDNGLPRLAFAQWVDNSQESLTKIITTDYGRIERQPTAAELSFWIAEIRATHSDTALLAWLNSSDEFWNNQELWTHTCSPPIDARANASADPPPDFTNVDCWLTQLYGNLLGRSPDNEGLQFFESVLGPSPTATQRFDVAYNAFELSEENAEGWITEAYYTAFNRPADPAGADFWYHWLVNSGYQTFAFWDLILASDESYAVALTQPTIDVPAARSAHVQRPPAG